MTILAVVGALACLDVFLGYNLEYFSASNRDAVKTLLHTRIHVNLMSRKLNFLTPFFVAWMWYYFNRAGQAKWIVYATSIVVLVASFFTISRAGWLGAVTGLFFLFLYARERKTLFVTIGIAVLVFVIAFVGSSDVRKHVIALKHRLPTLSERLPNWKICVKAVTQRPVFGWGVFEKETFHRMVRMVDGEHSKILKYPHPHNVFLELPLMWGLPFFAGYLGLFLYIYWKAWALSNQKDILTTLLWSALVGATMGSFWVNGFFSKLVWSNVFIALGIASSLLVYVRQDDKKDLRNEKIDRL